MRTLGFRTLLPAFVPPAVHVAEHRPTPGEPFTMARIRAIVEELKAQEVPPVKCPACGETFYLFAPPGPKQPTHWRCACGYVEQLSISQASTLL